MRTKSIYAALRANDVSNCPVRVVDYQPGNGTAYHLVFTPIPITDASERIGVGQSHLVTLVNYGRSMVVADTGGYLSPSYVALKLKVGAGDAVVLAEIIAHFTGRTADDASRPDVLNR
jgi:hypothetical protein